MNSTITILLSLVLTLFLMSIVSSNSYSLCYQEFANVSTACGGLSSGNYIFSAQGNVFWNNSIENSQKELIDGNWMTYDYAYRTSSVYTDNLYMESNYTKPANSLSSSLWQVKWSDRVITNYSLPISCWNYKPNTLQLIVSSQATSPTTMGAVIGCNNDTHKTMSDFVIIDSYFSTEVPGIINAIWEEAMIYNISQRLITLNTPINGSGYTDIITFNCSVSMADAYNASFTNLTFLIYNSSSFLINSSFTSLTGRQNQTTYNYSFSSDGNYAFNCLACDNNSICDTADSNNTFTVIVSPPNTTLNYPLNATFLNLRNIFFNFTSSDIFALDTCSLWGDWIGSWHKNYTWLRPTNNVMNWTQVNISSDGNYQYNVLCNGTTGKEDFAPANFSFTVDTANPYFVNNIILTVSGSQTINANISSIDINIKSCNYSIFNDSGTIEGFYSNVSYPCNSIITATVSEYGTYILSLFAKDYAENSNTSSFSFITSASFFSIGGGGGGGSKIPVISLKEINGTKIYPALEREIIYAEFYNTCSQKSKTMPCSFNTNELNIIIQKLAEKEFTIKPEDLVKFYNLYTENKLTQGTETSETIKRYNLIQSILGELKGLTIQPPSIDSPYVIFQPDDGNYVLSASLISSKPIKSCEVLVGSPDLTCVVSNTSIRVFYSLNNTDFISKIFSASINLVTDAPNDRIESKKVSLTFRVYNLGHSVFLGIPFFIVLIIIVLGLIILVVRFINKRSKSKPSGFSSAIIKGLKN